MNGESAEEVREYIAFFRRTVRPGMRWLPVSMKGIVLRTIDLDWMSDADARYVAREMKVVEAAETKRVIPRRPYLVASK